jgi:hypothetical protein
MFLRKYGICQGSLISYAIPIISNGEESKIAVLKVCGKRKEANR